MDAALQFLVDLIIQPGSSLKLVPVINISILCLIFVLSALMFYQSLAAVHVLVMGGLAIGLLFSVNWYDLSWHHQSSTFNIIYAPYTGFIWSIKML